MTQRPPEAAVAAPLPAARFPRQARVRTRAEYDRIFKHGRRVASPVLALHWHRESGAGGGAGHDVARLGLAVSRKVDPRAVGRNRIKRALRESFRLLRTRLEPGDYVLVARPAARGLEGPALVAAFHSLLRRAGALPAPDGVGTMQAPRDSASSPSTAPAPSPGGGPSLPVS